MLCYYNCLYDWWYHYCIYLLPTLYNNKSLQVICDLMWTQMHKKWNPFICCIMQLCTLVHFPFAQTKQQYIVVSVFIYEWFLVLWNVYKLIQRLGECWGVVIRLTCVKLLTNNSLNMWLICNVIWGLWSSSGWYVVGSGYSGAYVHI